MKKDPRKVTTPKGRVSFPHVFKAHSGFEGQKEKYSLTLLIPKATDLSEMKRAAFAAATRKWGPKEQGKWPRSLRMPFRDGDEKSHLEGYTGHWILSLSSDQRPGLVDKDSAPIVDDGTFYAGCYARATVSAFAYDKGGNRGISFGLQNLQKLGEGEPFSGRKRAEEDFDAVSSGPDGSDDPASYGDSADGGPDDGMGF